MKSFKEMYSLSYDTSGFNSGLVNWYNQLIDKTYENLTIIDVCKMIRQNILKDDAIKKAIELFLNNPYEGEYYEGGLLEVLTSLNVSLLGNLHVDELKTVLKRIKHDYIYFEWSDIELMNNFTNNIELMSNKIEFM